MSQLDTVPQEILERIAFAAATDTLLGPPSALVSLLATNRQIHTRLCLASNQYLYARIYLAKFDGGGRSYLRLAAPTSSEPSPAVLARALVHRFGVLGRIRAKTDTGVHPGSPGDGGAVYELLLHAYLMMLENAGKNEQQLRDYAGMEHWLQGYLFEKYMPKPTRPRGNHIVELWPPHTDNTSLAMWLFWFLLRLDDYAANDDSTWNVLHVLKVYALGAHKYPLTDPSWVKFFPEFPSKASCTAVQSFKTPPLATPAILSFLTLLNFKTKHTEFSSHLDIPMNPESNEWEPEFGRCHSLSRFHFGEHPTESFRPGSVEGTWEGMFTYTDFTAYAALLQGAPPPILQKSPIVRHKQTWKLREHHFFSPDSEIARPTAARDVQPLSAGDPLLAYIPPGTRIQEESEGLDIYDPTIRQELWYRRAAAETEHSDVARDEDPSPQRRVNDVLITGEGHSAWGQFTLVGRVRPVDGFISLCKEYVDHDRGKWIYRGYLVGNTNGILAGRWRDTLSPATVPGYEGCFLMTRRR